MGLVQSCLGWLRVGVGLIRLGLGLVQGRLELPGGAVLSVSRLGCRFGDSKQSGCGGCRIPVVFFFGAGGGGILKTRLGGGGSNMEHETVMYKYACMGVNC